MQAIFSLNLFSYFNKLKDTFPPPCNMKYCFNKSYAYILLVF